MKPSIHVVTPGHLLDPAPAIAAVRAGEVGLLDLGLGATRAARRQAIDRLTRFAGAGADWGVRWDVLGQPDRMPRVLDDLHGGRFPWLLVAGALPDAAQSVLEQARRVAARVLIETCEISEATAAARAGCDGIVLKANEAGGRVSRTSSFVLLQRLREIAAPCWLQGAWGPDTAAAAFLAGAAGVVLGEELWLARESSLPAAERERLARFDGSETTCWTDESGTFRLMLPVGAGEPVPAGEGDDDLATRLTRLWLDRGVADDGARPLGQGIAFAADLARRYVTVGGILQAYRDSAERHRVAVGDHPSITAETPLARDIGVRYPIFQGPMTHVSDNPAFARAVAESGGLPFVALALLRGPECRALLEQVRDQLGELPWGVGILGFVPAELREEQLAVLRDIRPGFAVIAGGRPRQAEALEKEGISTYLHVPSPGLLRTFLEQGARKFILEGRECGGHVGPRSSLVLWQSAIDVLLDAEVRDPAELHVIFAGGIHDEMSSAVVQTLAASLAERGVQIGALMGTAYLFTEEAVATGAIAPTFQKQALECRETVVLASGVGHATRCAHTAFADEFERRKSQLLREGRSREEVRFELEMLNLGRLRIASKGLARVVPDAQSADAADPGEGDATSVQRPDREALIARGAELSKGRLEAVDEKTQVREGLYMIGDLAVLRDGVVSMADLHEAVGAGGARRAAKLAAAPLSWAPPVEAREPAEPIAVIGMACRFAQSPDARAYWQNILSGFDAIREVPEERWRSDLYYTSDRLAPDGLYSKWGSFVEEARFDPVRYGIPPASVASIDPAQLLALDVARSALDDAGYGDRPFPRERTAVIFGAGGVNDLGIDYATRTMLPHYLARVEGLSDRERESTVAAVRDTTAPWTEDSFPGVLLNVISGRVANRLDLKGSNYVVDAACASSLAALHAAVQQLRARTSDMALVGCADASNNPFTFMCFARTHALTPSGRVRPFDDRADGIVLGEGFATVVLKRLADAERDGDRIYAVIRGVGTSSDGRNRSLTAPHGDSQSLAIERAYDEACIDPSSVGLVEAHATGTAVGDRSEISAMKRVFQRPGQERPFCAVGSVKSMIGHAKTAAGLAGLVKTVLALKNRVLPPTIHVEVPNKEADFERSPFWINTETRPWIHTQATPRRAGLSAFGFGGTNFHVVLEEYRRNYHPALELDLTPRAGEIFLWRRGDRPALVEQLRALRRSLGQLPADLSQLARSVQRDESARGDGAGAGVRLGIVATSVDDLRDKLDRALAACEGGEQLEETSGLYLSDAAPAELSQVAFLLPGQGSQQCHMLQDLVQYGPFGTELFEAADRLLADVLPRPLSSYIYPLPAFDRDARERAKAALDDTRIAQPAIGLVSLFACDVLTRFGLRPAVAAGHSYGEYTALCVAGYTGRDELLRMSAFRGRAIHEAAKDHSGGMVAVAASAEETQAALDARGVDARIANINGPSQTIIAGSTQAMKLALAQLREHGLAVRRVAVTAPFHTPAMEKPSRALGDFIEKIETRLPRIPVYSNVTAAPYPDDLEAIREQLAVHLARPVRFVEQIRAMHRDGARVFLEVGPGRILTGLVQRILGDEPHHAIALDMSGQPGWLRLGHLLAQTHALGLPVEAGAWFEGRGLDDVSTEAFLQKTRDREEVKPTDWMLAPGAVRPAAARAENAASAAAEVRPAWDATPSRAASNDAADSARSAQPATPPPAARPTAAPAAAVNPPGPASQPSPQAQAADAAQPATTATPVSHPLQTQMQDALNKWLDLQKEQLRLTERFLALQERLIAGVAPDAQWLAAAPIHTEPASAAPTALNVAPAPVLPDLRPTPSLPARDGSIADSVGAEAAAAPDAAPSATETPPEEPDDADAALPSVAAFRRDLLHEVSQRTGYPEDMLGLDVPLEASLGIDSIKTMEIFSALKPYHAILAAGSDDEEEVLAEFAQMKTLQDIIDRFSTRREQLADAETAQPAGPAPHAIPMRAAESSASGESKGFAEAGEPSGRDESEAVRDVTREPTAETGEAAPVERLVLRPVSAPANGDERGGLLALPEDQTVVILGEAPELASSLEAALASMGRGAFRIVPGEKTRRISPHQYEADLCDRAALQELAQQIRKNGTTRVGWLINLLPLDGCFREPGLNGQEAPLRLVRWLTNVAQVFEEDLRASGADGGGYLINVTTLDGHFGVRGARSLPVAQAGSLGFFKSLGREWRGIKVRNVDLDPEADSGALVLGFLRELAASDGPLEVGLDGEGRWRLDLVPSPVSSEIGNAAADLGLGPESVVLATGGAYGITATVLELLARETGARLVVVGRSDLRAPEDEDPETRQIRDRSALRARLIERARGQEPSPSPAAIERDLQRIEKDRAIRANLEALRAAGSDVEYYAVDVRDADAFGSLIDDLYRRYGRIDGALHGAGVIEDRWLRDKTPESLARVFETKANGAQILARKLRPESLRFLVFFSSVSGRFGNAGQADYSAANEYLNKLAAHLDREWPGRVVAVNWGPWESGMVSDGLRMAYAHRGIRLIEAEAGARALLTELGQVDSRVPEVVLTCSPDRIADVASHTHAQ